MVKSIRKRVNTPIQFILVAALFSLSACSVQKAQKTLLSAASLKGAHVGIAVYNESTNRWVDKHKSDAYYTPASNTKIQSCYLGMKYLKDSIPGWQFAENRTLFF